MDRGKKDSRAESLRSILPPVFVVGYMHSGTTLLINIIKQHSSIFSGNRETKYFARLPMIRRMYRDLQNDETLKDFVFCVLRIAKTGFNRTIAGDKIKSQFNLAWLDNNEELLESLLIEAKENRTHELVFSLVSDYMTVAMGKTRWVEKTPEHIYHIHEIVEVLPNALFVEITRDPRDVLSSKKTRKSGVWTSEKYETENRKRKNVEKGFDPFWDSLSWQAAIRAGLNAKQKYSENFYSVRYEDLTNDPENEAKKICSFIDIEFEPEMLHITTLNSADSLSDAESSKGIVTTSVGRWRTGLTGAEVALTQWQTAREMNEIGYELAQVRLKDRLWIPVLLTRSVFEFLHRLYRRWRLGGKAFLFNTVTNYWKRLKALFVS